MSFNCDYQAISVGFKLIAVTLYFTKKASYLSIGGENGLSPCASVNVFDGFINSGTSKSDFLKGMTVSVNGGALFGVGHTWSIGTGESNEGGITSPMLGVQVQYTILTVYYTGDIESPLLR
jgi:hypothetical protein